jgi:predicted nucleotidyltransferase
MKTNDGASLLRAIRRYLRPSLMDVPVYVPSQRRAAEQETFSRTASSHSSAARPRVEPAAASSLRDSPRAYCNRPDLPCVRLCRRIQPHEVLMQTEPVPVEALRALAAGHALRVPGLQLVVLFGSVARGSARPGSDADIGVLGGAFWEQLQLGSALAAELGREPHVVDLGQAPEALAYEIARTGLPLFAEGPFTWAQFQAGAALRFFDFQTARQRCVEGVRRRVLAAPAASRLSSATSIK